MYPGVYLSCRYSLWVLLPNSLLWLCLLYHALQASHANPGVIPRAAIAPGEQQVIDLPAEEQDRGQKQPVGKERKEAEASGDRHELVAGDGQKGREQGRPGGMEDSQEAGERKAISLYAERYCVTCCIMRPSFASHCSTCNHCVTHFDQLAHFKAAIVIGLVTVSGNTIGTTS